jgi:dihydrofolate reductase
MALVPPQTEYGIITLRRVTGLMACSTNYVISNKGALPWHCPEEIAFYRGMIRHQIVIMGRKTFDEMPAAFPNDHTVIVFSRTSRGSGPVTFVSSLTEFNDLKCLPQDKHCFMIGGGEIAALFLENNALDRFFLSRIDGDYSGDMFFPIALLEHHSCVMHKKEPSFTVYCYDNLRA